MQFRIANMWSIKMVKTTAKRAGALYTFNVDEAKAIATFTFDDKPDLVIPYGTLTEEIKTQLMIHGLKQKVIDAAAISRDADTGASATPAEKRSAMFEVANRLISGVWRVIGEGATRSGGLLERALTELYPNKDVKSWLEGLTDKQKAALRALPKVAAEIDKIRTKSAKASDVDADALLASLGQEDKRERRTK